MATSLSIETLLNERQKLIDERNRVTHQFNEQISQLDTSIELLSGKTVWETVAETKYDDESPNYIKPSYEEI